MNNPTTGSPEMVPIRRQDRAVTDESWIEGMLMKSPHGVLALVRDGEPFINMNIFVYDAAARRIYLHTAKEGQTHNHVEGGTRASFCVSEMGRLLPAPYARNFSVEYSGVVVSGTIEIIEDEHEARGALELLLAKYAPHLQPGTHYRPITPDELAGTSVYRLTVERWSGKRKVAPADHPGAYRYGRPAPPPWPDWREAVK